MAAQAQAAGLQQTAQVEELQGNAGADQNDGMLQTPGLRPNTLFPESAAPNTPQPFTQGLWSNYSPHPTSSGWVDLAGSPTRHESGTNYLLSRRANLASFVTQLQTDFATPQGGAMAPWQQQQMGSAARDAGLGLIGMSQGGLQNSPGAAEARSPAGGTGNLSATEQAVLQSLLARAGMIASATANVAGVIPPRISPEAAGLLEPTPFTVAPETKRASAEAAWKSKSRNESKDMDAHT